MEYAKQEMMTMGHNDTADVHHVRNKPKQNNRWQKEKQIKCFRCGKLIQNIKTVRQKGKNVTIAGNSIISNLCVDRTVYM
jgi:formylmethanofuran dehydrogenase subunit E